MKKEKVFLYLGLGALLILIAKKTYNATKKIMIETPGDYIKLMYPISLEVQRKTKIPFLFMLAQTALETGFGKSSLFINGYNIGGIKAKQGQEFIEAWTWEHVSDPNKYPNRDKTKDKKLKNGKTAIRIKSKFAKFKSLDEGVEAWTKIILLPRYSEAFKYTNSPELFVKEIKAGGYATATNYVKAVTDLIEDIKKMI